MKIEQDILLAQLTEITQEVQEKAKSLSTLTLEQLNWRPVTDSWSIAECLEHLNRYGNFYLPACQQSIGKQIKIDHNGLIFRSGLLGNYFAKLMLPTTTTKKMKSPRDKNPLHEQLGPEVLDVFLKQQDEMLEILQKAAEVDLTKAKTGISISKWIKLRLGDTLRVVIYHNLRHMKQVERVHHSFRNSQSSG